MITQARHTQCSHIAGGKLRRGQACASFASCRILGTEARQGLPFDRQVVISVKASFKVTLTDIIAAISLKWALQEF
ncbi:hypothetical protein J25TS5_29160 [Paenibacillus faecis]|nr:hypothetical protein J25TS5_29160 [Paenibacillus faecis]